jgi:hypothetical protein
MNGILMNLDGTLYIIFNVLQFLPTKLKKSKA